MRGEKRGKKSRGKKRRKKERKRKETTGWKGGVEELKVKAVHRLC